MSVIDIAAPGANQKPLALALQGMIPIVGGQVRLGFVGNSLTSRGQLASSPVFGDTIIGFTTWVKLLTKHRCYSPYTLNFGVPGTNTIQYDSQVTAALAAGCDIVVIGGVRNDAAGGLAVFPDTTPATITYNMRSAINRLLDAGVTVIAYTEPPPAYSTWFAPLNEWVALQYNRWLRAQKSVRRGLYVAELDPAFADITATDHWKPKANYIDGTDNVHPTTWGAYAFATPIANIINAIVPDQFKTIQNVDDYFDATSNPYGNLLGAASFQAGQMFAGTGGTATGGATGNIASGWVLTGASAGGATVVGSKVSYSDGRSAQRVVVSGTATVTNGKANLNTAGGAIAWGSINANEIVEASAEVSFGATTNIVSVDAFLFTTVGGVGYTLEAAASSILTPAAGYGMPTESGGPAASLSLILKTPPFNLTATPTGMQFFLSVGFVSPLTAAPVAGTFDFVSPQVAKVPPATI